jgi:hypothetical protein
VKFDNPVVVIQTFNFHDYLGSFQAAFSEKTSMIYPSTIYSNGAIDLYKYDIENDSNVPYLMNNFGYFDIMLYF